MKKLIALSFLALLFSCNQSDSNKGIATAEVMYQVDGVSHRAYVARPKEATKKSPGVLVVHEWWGHTEYVQKRARMLAKLGYVALALDMYGDGQTAEHPKDAASFAKRTMKNLPLAKKKFEAALESLKGHPQVDEERIGAIGYCFGGGLILQMVLMGVDLDAVVSFHGSLKLQEVEQKEEEIDTAILVLNGADDPMVSQEDIKNFKGRMKSLDADFEIVNYPGAKHAFTNPEATKLGKKFELPLAYNKKADRESWEQMKSFFAKELADD